MSINAALADRDANAQIASNTQNDTNNPGDENQKQREHKTVSGLNGKSANGAYISPSDAILSPASQKLAGFKQRQINKQNTKTPTSRSLFSRTASSVTDSSLEDSESINKQ